MRGVALALVLGVAVVSASPLITVTANPQVAYAPATIKVQIQVAPDDTNRTVCLEYDGGDYSKSCWDVDGSSPRTYFKTLRNLTAGDYVIRATVTRADQSNSIAVVQAMVLDATPDGDERK